MNSTDKSAEASGAGTPEDRAALFDEILHKIISRDAFVPIKNKNLNLDIHKAVLRYRDEMISADTDEKLLYVILKINNARKDRHVRVHLVKDGLRLDGVEVADESVRLDLLKSEQAPIRFAVDYAVAGRYFLFVCDRSKDIDRYSANQIPEIGDRLIAVNGQSFRNYFVVAEPYHRYATINGLWWYMAVAVSRKSREFPPHFYQDTVSYRLEKRNGEQYDLDLPYLSGEGAILWEGYWKGQGEFRYPGFKPVFKTKTYDLYRSINEKPVILLDWSGFKDKLMPDVDRLAYYAAEHQLLDHAVIFDGTRAGGGSLGAYAIQRLSPKPFKTTFGNLRISDIVPDFIELMRSQKASGKPMTAVDGGNWLIDWLETDVRLAITEGRDYSNNVPFKSSHLPKDSDGILQPADIHFRGPMVCLFSPHGGSHLDQFAAMIRDNGLAYSIGMPTGGYSNTWEWEETLFFPLSQKPVVKLMYSMGHTIRPNGELLEGNPARVDEYIPLTRDNYEHYYETILARALAHLGMD